MKEYPDITLLDLGTNEGFPENGPISLGPKLIDPYGAIQWVGFGSFTEELSSGPRDWWRCAPVDLASEAYSQEGRANLAEEIIAAAIETGALRCAIVGNSAKDVNPWESFKDYRLSIVDPEFIASAYSISSGWEDGEYQVTVGVNEDDSRSVWISGIWFFWDELLKLRPDKRQGNAPGQVSQELPVASPPSQSAIHKRPGGQSSGPMQRGRGRPAGKNGEPIAAFVLRVQAEGYQSLQGLSDDALGEMLKEEYFRLGLNLPESTNAARDARGVMRALAKIGTAEAE